MSGDSNDLRAVIPRGTFREVSERPPAHRTVVMAYRLSDSRKAVLVRYFRWKLWIPLKAMVQVWPKYELYANGWAIDRAKAHPSACKMEEWE